MRQRHERSMTQKPIYPNLQLLDTQKEDTYIYRPVFHNTGDQSIEEIRAYFPSYIINVLHYGFIDLVGKKKQGSLVISPGSCACELSDGSILTLHSSYPDNKMYREALGGGASARVLEEDAIATYRSWKKEVGCLN